MGYYYLALALLAASVRLLPHPPNVAPIAALGLFIGATLAIQAKPTDRWLAIGAPLVALLISDAIIGFYHWPVMAAVYLSFAASYGLGRLFIKTNNWSSIALTTFAGSLLFFLVTNAAVWAFTPLYQPTLAGLIESYTMALPFWRNSLIGDFSYSALFFGLYYLAGFNRQRSSSTANQLITSN